MLKNRFFAPATSALSIREEYHKDVEKRLSFYELGDDARNQIITDIYAKDDIYFSLNRSYQQIDISFENYCREQKLHTSLPSMLPYLCERKAKHQSEGKTLYKHQANAIESILAEKTTIISTGTGSGKTESFLIPILHHCLANKGDPGIKAVILYPLNALANDQIRRIITAVKGKGIRVGCFVGSTLEKKERQLSDPDELCISRQEMKDKPPDVLITNYVMLDRLITEPDSRSMFVRSEQTLKYIVIDEVHYYRGTKGANLSLLLRRLRTLCKKPLVQIGASGTLHRGGGYFPDSKQDSIEQFARLIFGSEAVSSNGFQLINPEFEELKNSQPEPLPLTDNIKGDTFLYELNKSEAEILYEQLSGKSLTQEYQKGYRRSGSIKEHPMYHFANRSQFICRMREKLDPDKDKGGPCTFREFVDLFSQLYTETHGKVPSNPRSVVEAYWTEF